MKLFRRKEKPPKKEPISFRAQMIAYLAGVRESDLDAWWEEVGPYPYHNNIYRDIREAEYALEALGLDKRKN